MTAEPPTATSQPIADPTSAATTEAIRVVMADQINLAPFTLTLPASWPVLQPTDHTWANRLHQIAAAQPNLTHYLAALAATAAVEKTVALAWPPTPTPDLLLVAAVTSAEGLTLQNYLAAAAEELAQSRLLLGAAVTIHKAELRYDLHQAHLPVATLRYTLPATNKRSSDGALSTGYQVAIIDKTGNDLLLLTAVTQDVDPTDALALIDAIVATYQEE